MHSGKYVFAQLLPFLDRYEFNKCVKNTFMGGNYCVFTCRTSQKAGLKVRYLFTKSTKF